MSWKMLLGGVATHDRQARDLGIILAQSVRSQQEKRDSAAGKANDREDEA